MTPTVCIACCCILDFLPYNATAFSLNTLRDFVTLVISICEFSLVHYIRIHSMAPAGMRYCVHLQTICRFVRCGALARTDVSEVIEYNSMYMSLATAR
jgi:hypothetical protein